MNALILLVAVASAPPQAPPLEQRVEALERRVAEIERRLPQAPPVRVVTASPVFPADDLPQPTPQPVYAPQTCVGGQCAPVQSTYSTPYRLFRRLR